MNEAMNPELLPESLKVLAGEIGFDAVLRLVEAFGGRKEYISATLRQDHPIILKCGPETGAALVRLFSGTWYQIPRMSAALKEARNRLIVAGYAENQTVNDLARKFLLTERQIWNILKQPLPAFRKPTLERFTSPGQIRF